MLKQLLPPILAGALLAACATQPVLAPTVPVADYRENIELNGRLSVNYLKDGKPETLSGKFNWQQAGERVDVALASPLGQTIAKITVTPGEARLEQGEDKPVQSAPDIDTLTTHALGWQLPVSGLREWLQGYATKFDGTRWRATPGENTVITRDGWRLRYVAWHAGAQGAPAPKRIDAERPAMNGADELAIRIVIDAQD